VEMSIDRIDSRIICLLQKDGRFPFTKIAEELNLSEATIRSRTQRLIRDKVISIVAVCEPRKLGFALTGNIKLQVSAGKMKEVIDELRELPEITYIALMTGPADVDMDFVVKSLEELNILIHNKLGIINGIIKIETSIITSYEKDKYDYGTVLSQNTENQE
jgi:Lrp/AsnC family transcriptional regulator, regulator for asnA, asnC and gidA